MPSITRYGVKSEYIAPERVPAFDRRWDRAMADLNLADDDRGLAVAVVLDSLDRIGAVVAKLNRVDLGLHHSGLSALTRESAERSAPPRLAPVTDAIVTNGPNSQPTALHTVGQKVAA